MIRALIFSVVFAAGFLAGGAFPSFSAQYHQILQARYDQVSIYLAPFQAIADRYHDGSLDALVRHHLRSTDPTFYAEGEAIQAMINSQARLAESKAAADASYVDQAVYLYRHLEPGVARQVWSGFTPTLVTSERGVTFSLTVATVVLVLFGLAWMTLGAGIRRLLGIGSARRS